MTKIRNAFLVSLAPAVLALALSVPTDVALAGVSDPADVAVLPGSWHADHAVSLGVRNLPLGASVTGEFGYGTLLWGEKKGQDFTYGYVRGVARLRTSGLINRVDASFEIRPISFVGIRGGYAVSQRWSDGSVADCSYAGCLGSVASPYAGASLLLGHAGVVFAGDVQWGMLTPSEQGKVFYDETLSLIGLQGGDHGLSTTAALTYCVPGSPWLGGALHMTDQMLGSGQSGTFAGAFGRYKSGSWAYALGAGSYASNINPRGLAVFAQVRWTGKPSLELN